MSLDGLLEGMRDTVARTLPTDVELWRRTRSRTATGGSSYAWAKAATVRGRVHALSAQDMEVAARLEVHVTNTVMLPYDATVTANDRLKIGGVDFDVYAVFADPSQPVISRVLVAKAGAS